MAQNCKSMLEIWLKRSLLVALWFIISSNPITAIGQVKPKPYSNQDRGAESLHILHQNFSHFPFCVIIKNNPLWNGNSSITYHITKIGETHTFENSLNDLWWCQSHCIGLSLILWVLFARFGDLLWYCKVMKSTLWNSFKNATKEDILVVKEFQVQGKNTFA